jgi:hypothetical protein
MTRAYIRRLVEHAHDADFQKQPLASFVGEAVKAGDVSLWWAYNEAHANNLAALAATSAPAQGLDSTATLASITASDWRGPYLQAVPKDFDGVGEFTYTTTLAGLGNVRSGIAAYSSW